LAVPGQTLFSYTFERKYWLGMSRPFHPILAVYLALAMPGLSAPGDLDPTWGGTGKVLTNPTAGQDICNAIVRQSDGKIVAVGSTGSGNTAVMRYLPNGQLDLTFSGNGMELLDLSGVGLSDIADAVALDAQGRIVIAGYAETVSGRKMLVARFLSDGMLDPTFGSGGKVIQASTSTDDWARSIVIQADGKIVIAGFVTVLRRQVCVARYLENGTLDTSFNGTGRFISVLGERETQALDVALQPDGKIIVAGAVAGMDLKDRMLVLRLLPNGTLDTTFNSVGFVGVLVTGILDVANGMVLLPDGRIVLAGTVGGGGASMFGLARCLPDGSLDATFNGTGTITTSFDGGATAGAEALAMQSDGRIVAAGFMRTQSGVGRFAVARYLRDGSLDPTFGNAGRVTTEVPFAGIQSAFAFDVALVDEEHILVAGVGGNDINGLGAFALVRYEDGAPLAPLAQWKLGQLGDANAPDLDDVESDGLAHLAEYGLVLSPTAYSPMPGANAFAYPDGTRLRLFLNRDPARNDVNIEVRAAGDPAGPWTTIASSVLGGVTTGAGYVGGDGAGPGLKTVEVRDVVDIPDAAQRFLRLRVTVGLPPAAPAMALRKIVAPKAGAKVRR
jgi:uncharacterized delta-60 repeat protein